MNTELPALAPHPIELAFLVALVVAVSFAVYAVTKMVRREWTLAAGLVLVVLTFVVPFSGPLLVGAFAIREVLRRRRTLAQA